MLCDNGDRYVSPHECAQLFSISTNDTYLEASKRYFQRHISEVEP